MQTNYSYGLFYFCFMETNYSCGLLMGFMERNYSYGLFFFALCKPTIVMVC